MTRSWLCIVLCKKLVIERHGEFGLKRGVEGRRSFPALGQASLREKPTPLLKNLGNTVGGRAFICVAVRDMVLRTRRVN
jgi:hypothetical protein